MSTLFDKLGGQQGLEQVVDEFYKRVMADNTLNKFFANTNMDKQRQKQVAFFAKIFDGPDQYSGRSMDTTHTGMNLQQQHFDAIAKYLSEALAARGVSSEDANAAVARVDTLKGSILNK
ncbi:MAG: group 1 truncated hemoglobin [Scytonema sp. RU_4_4]|nr:group 1 truncated hemoglobin [Scytonema sp. RU_4_4]NJR76210.1 group 1 truncated hemoglobin [Scytonema sp. CRU_2_7]